MILEQDLLMEELLELKNCLLNQEYDRAFSIVEDLETMGRQDKIDKLESFLPLFIFDKHLDDVYSVIKL